MALKIQSEWLTQRVEDAPTAYHSNLSAMAALRIRMAWQKLKRSTMEGDEMWAFENPANTWKRMGKKTGYAIVREGEIVQSVVVLSE